MTMNPYKAFHMGERGSSHIEKGTVCQDAHWADCNAQRSLIIVADGHGSRQYCRSDQGSQFAVSCAAESIDAFLSEQQAESLLREGELFFDTMQKLCSCIIAKWHAAVRDAVAVNPFTAEELADIPPSYASDYLAGNRVEKAYGTTLIAVFTIGERCFGIHIGDGKCVAVYEDGSTDEPIPWDDECCFNITTSLCDAEAAMKFRFAEIRKPVAVFIGTDGIDDSYGTGLSHFYLNIVQQMISMGYEEAVDDLRGYIGKISERGSHDDVSLAGIVYTDKLSSIAQNLEKKLKLSALKLEQQKLERNLPDMLFSVQKETMIRMNLAEQLQDDPKNQQLLEKLRLSDEMLEKAEAELEKHRRKIACLQQEIADFGRQSDQQDESTSETEGTQMETDEDPWKDWETSEKNAPETWEEHNGSTGSDSKMPEE